MVLGELGGSTKPGWRFAHCKLGERTTTRQRTGWLRMNSCRLNACRLDHVNELGLRLRGLAAEQPDPVLDAQVDRALQDPGQRLQLQGVLRAHDSDPEVP